MIVAMPPLFGVLFLWGLAALVGWAGPPPWELYLSPDLSFALYKPGDWSVSVQPHSNGRSILVVDPQSGATVTMTLITTSDQSNNSVGFASRTLGNMRVQIPALKLSWARSTADKKRTVIETTVQDSGGQRRFRGYFLMDYPTARFWGYETRAADFARLQPALLNIVTNLTLLNQSELRKAAAQRLAPKPLPLFPRALGDGSATMQVPSGWTFQGAQGSALCLGPDGSCGFSFGTTTFWGPSNLPNFNNSSLPGLHYAYMQPLEAVLVIMQQVGTHSIEVEQRWVNSDRAQQARAATNRSAQSESGLLHYRTRSGLATKGYYDALAFSPLPSGQWMVLFWGVWAPQATFDSWLPTLIPMADSYRINEQWASNYIQQGLERLRHLMAQTRAAMADTANYARETNLAIFQEKMRSGDYLDYKRTSMIRGEQEWVSQVEGGALYKSDSWGLSRDGQTVVEGQDANYNNFRGENPVFRENMTPVDASREVYESVFRGRP